MNNPINIKNVENTGIEILLFKKRLIQNISVYGFKQSDETWSFHGKVTFKNDQFAGERSFKGQTMEEVIELMKQFIETL